MAKRVTKKVVAKPKDPLERIADSLHSIDMTLAHIAHSHGSLSSHTARALEIFAKKASTNVIWWDPTIEDTPVKYEHGAKVQTETMYMLIPQHLRKGNG